MYKIWFVWCYKVVIIFGLYFFIILVFVLVLLMLIGFGIYLIIVISLIEKSDMNCGNCGWYLCECRYMSGICCF